MKCTVYITKAPFFLSFNKTVLNQLNSLIYFVIVMNVYVLVDRFSIIYHCGRFINKTVSKQQNSGYIPVH
jgi:hypothetical protein